jgi:4-hydroxybenzoate polyprenyltransferase
MKFLLYSLRPKHWIKNLFVFLPLIFGRKLMDFGALLTAAEIFVLFCFASSAVYLMNDIIDYNQDKLHPVKRLRPIASGQISCSYAAAWAIALGTIALLFTFRENPLIGAVLLAYVTLNILYSLFLKQLVIIDVFCLSLFFILRLLAGTYAADVALSHWILVMGGLLALFLGFNKRRQEFKILGKLSTQHRSVLRKYNRYFIDQMIAVITASTVVAYTFYTVDDRTLAEVGSDHMIFTVPFVYYGIFRYLYLLHKRRMDGDPTRILVSDFPMQFNIAMWLATAIAVIYFKL